MTSARTTKITAAAPANSRSPNEATARNAPSANSKMTIWTGVQGRPLLMSCNDSNQFITVPVVTDTDDDASCALGCAASTRSACARIGIASPFPPMASWGGTSSMALHANAPRTSPRARCARIRDERTGDGYSMEPRIHSDNDSAD